jgi:lysophospholipase L1-like esterase
LGAVPCPISRRPLVWAGLALIALVSGCGDDDDEAAGGTLPLFGGTVPTGGPAIDLTPSPGGTEGGRDVVVIGDSLTVAATPQIITGATGIDADVTVLAEVGRRISFGLDPPAGTDVVADVLAEGDPDLVVVALGTNDIGKYSTIEEYAAEVDELVDLVPQDQPLVWINTYHSRLADESAALNAAVLETLSERGTATIGRWSSIAQRDGMLRGDGFHPSDDGVQEFADLVVNEIENWLG